MVKTKEVFDTPFSEVIATIRRLDKLASEYFEI